MLWSTNLFREMFCVREEPYKRTGLVAYFHANASALLWGYLNAINQNVYWREIEHYHNFTREKIYAELQKAGFRPVNYAVSERYRCCMEILAEPA